MKKILALILILATLSMVFVPPANAATQAQIDASTTLGLAWLASQQLAAGCPGTVTSGCWSPTDRPVGTTALALWKLETHAVLQGLSPFDPAYQYSTNVVNGLNYLFANAVLHAPSSGVYFTETASTGDLSYDTALTLIAIVSGTEPNRVVNVAGSPVNGMTYHDVAVDLVNFLAWAQKSTGTDTGGWTYDPVNGPTDRADQSNTGHVVMALHFAEAQLRPSCGIGGFGLSIPAAVKTLLNTWIGNIQAPDGGSGYYLIPGPNTYWVNIYKTGHLLQEMAFVGDTSSTPRVLSAVAYLVSHWYDPDVGNVGTAGWRGAPPGLASSYIATLTVMKGLTALGIDRIGGISWFDDIANTLLAQQNAVGSWPMDGPGWSDTGLVRSTAWALLTLEKAAPCVTTVPVGGTVAPPSLMTGVLALLPWILMAFAAVGAGAYAMRRRYASPLLARIR
jgi:hypothetical protein